MATTDVCKNVSTSSTTVKNGTMTVLSGLNTHTKERSPTPGVTTPEGYETLLTNRYNNIK